MLFIIIILNNYITNLVPLDSEISWKSMISQKYREVSWTFRKILTSKKFGTLRVPTVDFQFFAVETFCSTCVPCLWFSLICGWTYHQKRVTKASKNTNNNLLAMLHAGVSGKGNSADPASAIDTFADQNWIDPLQHVEENQLCDNININTISNDLTWVQVFPC